MKDWNSRESGILLVKTEMCLAELSGGLRLEQKEVLSFKADVYLAEHWIWGKFTQCPPTQCQM